MYAAFRCVKPIGLIEGPDIRMTTHQATYEDGLLALPEDVHPTLVAFLGSNIGQLRSAWRRRVS